MTSQGHYFITSGFNTIMDDINKYVNEGLILNPDFQRGHVWTEEQQIAFVEYILQGGPSGRDIYLNHTKWDNTSRPEDPGDEKGTFVVVDGLQRLTAISKFLNNEIKAFGYYHKEYEDIPRDVKTYMIIHINDLPSKKKVLEWYLQFNGGGTVHTKEELIRVKKMIENIDNAEKAKK